MRKLGEFVTTIYGISGFIESVVRKKKKTYYKIRDAEGLLHLVRSTSLI